MRLSRAVRELGIDARVIRLERNLGFTCGNNISFLRISGVSKSSH